MLELKTKNYQKLRKKMVFSKLKMKNCQKLKNFSKLKIKIGYNQTKKFSILSIEENWQN